MGPGIESVDQPFYPLASEVKRKQMRNYLFYVVLLLVLIHSDNSFIEAAQENAATNEQDSDNSIRGSQEAQSIQQQQQASTQADVASIGQTNLLVPTPMLDAWLPVTPRRNSEEVWQLERRLEILEQELRKSFVNQAEFRQSFVEQQMEPRWTQVTARLELMEKFITAATKKLYETEARVRQLEKCDCRLSCRWRPATSEASSGSIAASSGQNLGTNNNNYQNEQGKLNETSLIKMDGQVWEHKCDVCSCHRGRVRCKHVICPTLSCSNPQQVAGKCCPVCYKSCVYRKQTVKHGNKLVINSNRDTCKECMCIDGRFKCQRVELPEQHSRSHEFERDKEKVGEGESFSWSKTSSTHLPETQASTSDNNATAQVMPSSSTRHQRSTLAEYNTEDDFGQLQVGERQEIDEDVDNNGENGSYLYENSLKNGADRHGQKKASRRLRSTTSDNLQHNLPLVCPQIDCKLEDQIYFQNDCCTYCKNHDFCAQNADHLCHPHAFCVNTLSTSPVNNLTSRQPLKLDSESMFSCHCKSGFTGDGRFCRDIDECSQKNLNDCDPKTTNCVNLPGTYECRCKRGFKVLNFTDMMIIEEPSKASSGEALSKTTPSQANKSSKPNKAGLKSCADINECRDGLLNKCHPQAKCINMQGSYKCRCKYGYLGNGFECHKWFSSDPNVAAYFHRHSSSSSDTEANKSSDERTEGSKNKVSLSTAARPAPHKINMPLESFPDDPGDDQLDDSWATRAEPEDSGDDYDDTFDEVEDDDGDENENRGSRRNETNEKAQKLTESKWEPLKLVAESLISLGQPQQIDNNKTDQYLMDSRSTNINNNHNNNLLQTQQQNLNTRTMFFQPPPRFLHKENLTQQVATTNSYDNILNQTISSKSFIEVSDKRHNGAQVKSSPSSDRSNLIQSYSSPPSSSIAQQNINHHRQAPSLSSSSSLYKPNDSPGYKRGTIITSAITSPTRGYSSKKAHSSSSSQPHRALGVTSSASTSRLYPFIPKFISSSQYYSNCFNLILAKFDFINSYSYSYLYLYLLPIMSFTYTYLHSVILNLYVYL